MTANQINEAERREIRMSSAVPTFLVSDVGSTVRWYVDQLGFYLSGNFPDDEPYAYASLQRNGAEIMLLRLAGYEKPDLSAQRPEGLWDAYFRMRGVHAFYEMLSSQNFINMPLKRQRYGDWEFEVRDPNGYILVFSELVE
ncbi:MAG TPA: VOC family protein [Pyrinomonadaceae bacterium]|nr:VOC family protein [Pyrinomonadaceae bacterium]